jgi:hypothetical protein
MVVLSLDSMVMDNDEAAKRHGVTPTYKKVKGVTGRPLTDRREKQQEKWTVASRYGLPVLGYA